jgi:hypothetical protein
MTHPYLPPCTLLGAVPVNYAEEAAAQWNEGIPSPRLGAITCRLIALDVKYRGAKEDGSLVLVWRKLQDSLMRCTTDLARCWDFQTEEWQAADAFAARLRGKLEERRPPFPGMEMLREQLTYLEEFAQHPMPYMYERWNEEVQSLFQERLYALHPEDPDVSSPHQVGQAADAVIPSLRLRLIQETLFNAAYTFKQGDHLSALVLFNSLSLPRKVKREMLETLQQVRGCDTPLNEQWFYNTEHSIAAGVEKARAIKRFCVEKITPRCKASEAALSVAYKAWGSSTHREDVVHTLCAALVPEWEQEEFAPIHHPNAKLGWLLARYERLYPSLGPYLAPFKRDLTLADYVPPLECGISARGVNAIAQSLTQGERSYQLLYPSALYRGDVEWKEGVNTLVIPLEEPKTNAKASQTMNRLLDGLERGIPECVRRIVFSVPSNDALQTYAPSLQRRTCQALSWRDPLVRSPTP